MVDKNRLMETLLKLLSVPGISGTEGEASIAEKIYSLLGEIPYYQLNKDKLELHYISGDPYKRSFVSAMYSSGSEPGKTVVISGHMDVVDIEEYGHLKEYAFDPDKLAKHIEELSLDENTEKDLKSGEWLFGRGIADMRYGLALAIELLREFTQTGGINGNILFLAVPGEESNSEGMLAAAEYLSELQENQGYEFTALLMPECYLQKKMNDLKRYIHVGACGKIMPMFYFTGKETHVCEPFNGFDPTMLAAEVNRLLSMNTDVCESSRGAITPPPICLKQMDMKTLYSVQTPLAAASYYNLVTLGMPVVELTEKLVDICNEAFANIIKQVDEKYLQYSSRFGTELDRLQVSPCVIMYSELAERVGRLWGDKFEKHMDSRLAEWEKIGLDNQTKAINIVKETYEWYPDKAPMIILSYIPPYYPDFYPEMDQKNTKELLRIVEAVSRHAEKKFGEELVLENYYMGVSDLSYTGMNDSGSMEEVCRNMPGYGSIYSLPVSSLKELHIPGIILGAYGKDMHKYTERLNIPFAFDVLPDLYEYAITSILC
ncbi:MAG TPA: M20/M25/M40 family metallo-hydrolase [Negativicutes bacterium]|nr:M20/M25/M40 family metallo-hydrolase [Negativicutes bacterium]